MSDEREWQQRDEQERFTRAVEVLSTASIRALEESEILFLASELGLSRKDFQLTKKRDLGQRAA